MGVLTIAVHKGGTGKTTCTVHQVFDIDRRGKSVCMIDCDTQGNASGAFGEYDKSLPGAGYLFREDWSTDFIRKTDAGAGGISVIAADDMLDEVEQFSGEPELIFKANVRALLDHFDYVVIDTPPTLGFGMLAPLIASDFVYSPIRADKYSLDGLGSLLDRVVEVQDNLNHGLKFLGFVINFFQKNNIRQREIKAELEEDLSEYLVPYVVGNRTPISFTADTGLPVWSLRTGSARVASKEFNDMLDWVYNKMEGAA